MSHYETSVDFTNDLMRLVDHLKKADDILKSPKFHNWMKDTADNYEGADALPRHAEMISNLVSIAASNVETFSIELFSLDDKSNC